MRSSTACIVICATGWEPGTLVSRAAADILGRGGVPIYLHGRTNAPSAHVAEAAGFPD